VLLIPDREERRDVRQRISELTANIKHLKTQQKWSEKNVQQSKKVIKEKKDSKKEFKAQIGRKRRDVLLKVEKILRRNRIENPNYHSGLYNGKAMNKLMTNSQKIMEEFKVMLIEIPTEDRCSDKEVLETMGRFTNILSVFDELFSLARTPSGLIGEEDINKLQDLVTLALQLWRGLDITPKVHAIKDHLVPQIMRFKGIGDLGEYFVERSHQDGIRQQSWSKNAKERVDEVNQHCRWEHKQTHPSVMEKAQAMGERSIR
jgi:hypothetical protein